ncbi:MAG: polysaccharide deacetylase family protein [Patescibacteria group bacterium]
MFSLDDNYILVNYHYVENPRPGKSGIHPCSIIEFEKQMEFLSKNYKIVSIPEVFNSSKENITGKFCAITFDDGLKDQYENAFPVLKKYDISATFFPITSTLSNRIPPTHKLHVLLSISSAEEISNIFSNFIDKFYPDLKTIYSIPKDKRIYSRRLHEDILTANLKETLISLNYDIKNRFLRYCFKMFHLDEKSISKEIFMSEEELKKISKEGMNIGGHSHGHYSMEAVNPDFIKKDIQLSCEILSEMLDNYSRIYSYTHGHNSNSGIKILTELGFEYGVTTQQRGFGKTEDPFLLPRYDSNDIKLVAEQ